MEALLAGYPQKTEINGFVGGPPTVCIPTGADSDCQIRGRFLFDTPPFLATPEEFANLQLVDFDRKTDRQSCFQPSS